MNRLFHQVFFLLLLALTSCTKENFEVIQIEQEMPDPPVVLVVDCEGLGLNVGDTCTVQSNAPNLDGLPGIVSGDCQCEPLNNLAEGETVTIAFWRQTPGSVVTVSTTSEPSFIAGQLQIGITRFFSSCPEAN